MLAYAPMLALYWNVVGVFILGAESCRVLSQKAIGPESDVAEAAGRGRQLHTNAGACVSWSLIDLRIESSLVVLMCESSW